MTKTHSAQPVPSSQIERGGVGSAAQPGLLKGLIWLAVPVLVENVLHIFVGLNDTWLASHLPEQSANATAAIGLVTYVLWLLGLIAGAIGTGSTAIIARAVGAKHQRLANGVCGQSVMASIIAGVVITLVVVLFATGITHTAGLRSDNPAARFSVYYLKVLGWSAPFMMLMLAANACLRGAGDSLTPAITFVIVDVVNMVFSVAMTRGYLGFPVMGFRGIAIGTVIAYVVGGLIQLGVLLSGLGKIRLFSHRLWPQWTTLKRVLRIGLPSGVENMLTWGAQFVILRIIFHIDPTNVQSAAHIITIRIESLSFMVGLAVATAAATIVGQSLGMRDAPRARRAAYLSYLLGGSAMALGGLCFILFRKGLAHVLSDDPRIAALSATCLFITAFSQPGFAATLIFGGALRGAGDTFIVMLINIASIVGLRLVGVVLATLVFHGGLQGVWLVLAIELSLRGIFMFARFRHGAWMTVEV